MSTTRFERLGMHRTAERHGVLIYVAVIGDQGIHARVGEAYWRQLVAAVTAHFRDERPRDGFIHAIGELGALLRRDFPAAPATTMS